MTTYTLTTFSDGDTLLASEMNDNFQYCLADTTSKVDALAASLESSTASLTGNNTFTGQNTFTGTTWLPANVTIAKENNDKEGGQLVFQRADNDPLSASPCIDIYNGSMRIVGQVGGVNRIYTLPISSMSSGTIIPLYANGSGYRIYSDGFRVQWGTAQMSGKSKTVSFPQAFSNTSYQVIAVGYAIDGNEDCNVNAEKNGQSSAKFHCNYNNISFGWLAVGY